MRSGILSKHPTLAESVADWIGEEVLSGRWEPGRRITEAEVAERVGVSRQPVREALRLLGDSGIVRIIPRVGAVVADYNTDMIDQLYRVRAQLESWLIGLAVPRATEEQAAALRTRVRAWLAADSSDLVAHYDEAWAIRREVLSWSGNAVAVDLADDLRRRLRGFPKVLRRDPGHLDIVSTMLNELAEAVTAGDVDRAAATASDYLITNIDRVQSAFAQSRAAR